MWPQTWSHQTHGTWTSPSVAGIGSCDNMIKQSNNSWRSRMAIDKCSRILARNKLRWRLHVHVVRVRQVTRTAFLNRRAVPFTSYSFRWFSICCFLQPPQSGAQCRVPRQAAAAIAFAKAAQAT